MIKLKLAFAAFTALALIHTMPAKAESAAGIAVELNKLEPKEGACLAYLVFENGTQSSFEAFTLDLYIFGLDGTIAKRLAINGAPLPVGKTKVSSFSIKDVACETMGNILVNDVIKCKDGGGAREDCVELVQPSSRNSNKFFK